MSNVLPREDKTPVGIFLMATAVLFFVFIDSSAKWLAIAGIPFIQIVFARYFGHLVYAVIYFIPKEGLSIFRSNAPGRQSLRSLFLLLSTTLNFAALKFLPLTVTTTISMALPIVITLLAMVILKEKVGIRRLMAVFVGFVGVLVVIQPWGATFQPALLISVASLIFASLYFVMTRMLAGIESIATHQIWSSGLAAMVLLPFAMNVWVWPETWGQIAFLLAIGFFGLTAHIFVTSAHRFADASKLAPMSYTQVFYAAVVGVLLFNTWPTVWTLVGGAIIICSGLYIWQREKALGKLNSKRP